MPVKQSTDRQTPTELFVSGKPFFQQIRNPVKRLSSESAGFSNADHAHDDRAKKFWMFRHGARHRSAVSTKADISKTILRNRIFDVRSLRTLRLRNTGIPVSINIENDLQKVAISRLVTGNGISRCLSLRFLLGSP